MSGITTTADLSILYSLPTGTVTAFSSFLTSSSSLSSIASSSSASNKAIISSLATFTASLTKTLQVKDQKLNQLAALRVLKNKGTITSDQLVQYNSLQQDIRELDKDVNASQDLLTQQASVRDDIKQTTMSRLKGAQSGTFAYSKVQDLYDYVIRTQALNPYSRERQCDRDFIALLQTIGNDTNERISLTQSTGNLLIGAVSSAVG